MKTPVERISELKSDPLCAEVITAVDAAVKLQLGSYKPRNPSKQSKAIKDAIWGMVRIHPCELVILDSPVLQRMRRIKQLGMSYLTYPTAGYSRFEHILGAVYQAEWMWRAVLANTGSEAQTQSNTGDLKVLRLAALLHDIGHMPFSHVSEQFFGEKEHPDEAVAQKWKSVRDSFGTILGTDTVSLTEILSVAMICTDSMRQLLDFAEYNDDQIALAALLIVGRSDCVEKAYLGQIISNMIDADKLDYMFRDATVTGVPLAIDLERLLFKISLRSIKADECPNGLTNYFDLSPESHSSIVVLATDLTGRKHFHELMVARALLYDRVYQHHKTRAAEKLLMKLLTLMDPTPYDLLKLDDSSLLQIQSEIRDKAQTERIQLVGQILNRQLPRRVFAICGAFLETVASDLALISNPEGQATLTQEQATGYSQLDDVLSGHVTRKELAEEITAAFARVNGILGKSDLVHDLIVDQIRDFAPPEFNLVVLNPDETVMENAFDPQGAGYPQLQPRAHVYARVDDSSALERLFVAIEWVLADKFKLWLGSDAGHQSKIRWDRVNDNRREIDNRDQDFFKGKWTLRGTSCVLKKASIRNRVKDLASRFAAYNTTEDTRVTDVELAAFIDQFPDNLVESLVTTLESFRLISPSTFSASIEQMAAENASPWSPLELDPTKSASVVAYLGKASLKSRVMDLNQALLSESSELNFFEESIISGTQACDVVEQWATGNTKEKLSRKLTSDELNKLRSVKLHFRFVFGRASGVENLKAKLAEHRIDADIKYVVDLDEEDALMSKVALDGAAREKLERFLNRVGARLLQSTKGVSDAEKWTPALISERLLGYGNLGLLVATPYNCPTSTVTALWKRGWFEGMMWRPLFQRVGETDATKAWQGELFSERGVE